MKIFVEDENLKISKKKKKIIKSQRNKRVTANFCKPQYLNYVNTNMKLKTFSNFFQKIKQF